MAAHPDVNWEELEKHTPQKRSKELQELYGTYCNLREEEEDDDLLLTTGISYFFSVQEIGDFWTAVQEIGDFWTTFQETGDFLDYSPGKH